MNKSVSYEVVWIFLRQFFNYRQYKEGVADAKEKILQDPLYSRRWAQISNDILNRAFLRGEPFILVTDGANQVLDENSDDEAYKWLELMVSNIERKDGKIIPY